MRGLTDVFALVRAHGAGMGHFPRTHHRHQTVKALPSRSRHRRRRPAVLVSAVVLAMLVGLSAVSPALASEAPGRRDPSTTDGVRGTATFGRPEGEFQRDSGPPASAPPTTEAP